MQGALKKAMTNRAHLARPSPHYVLLVLGLLVAQTSLAPAVAAAPHERQSRECVETAPEELGGVPVTVTRGPVENSVTLSVDSGDAQSAVFSRWGIELPPGTEVYSKSGLGTPAGHDRLYRPLSSAENYTLTYTYEENVTPESALDKDVEKYEGEERWGVAPLPRSYNGEAVSYRTASEAVIGQWTVYFGDYTMTTVSNGCHRIRLVVPDSVDMNQNPTTILASLQYTDRHLGGQRYREVTIFVTPEDFVSSYEGFARRSDIVVSGSGPYFESDARSHIWIHEYIHTRQRYQPGGDFEWWTEASANYLSIRMGLHSGYLSPERYNEVLEDYGENDTGEAVLANQSTWHNFSTYKRGVLALSQLDSQLREDTNESMTVVTAFNATTAHRPHTHGEFIALLENRTGNSYNEWTADYVQGTTAGELRMQADTPSTLDVAVTTLSENILAIVLGLVAILLIVYDIRRQNGDKDGKGDDQ